MELYEEIRREYEHGGGTIKGVARQLGVHRRMVREAVANAVPPERKVPARVRPKLAGAIAFIEAILEADRRAPARVPRLYLANSTAKGVLTLMRFITKHPISGPGS